MTIEDAIAAADAEWLRIARPIINAMFGVEDALHPVNKARLADPMGYAGLGKRSAAGDAWSEAQHIAGKAMYGMRSMLDGIRDNVLCDYRRSCLIDMSETEEVSVDEWNDRLDAEVVSVDAAVRMVGDEQ